MERFIGLFQFVSIRAPARGRLGHLGTAYTAGQFRSAPPRGGDSDGELLDVLDAVSIRAPARGRLRRGAP